jgi:hypothetical protein
VGNHIKILLNSLLLLSCCLFLISFVTAAPAQWGIAINQNTKECAGYWAGDEFSQFTLPSGWKAYYPEYDSDSWTATIETPLGTCDFEDYSEQACCNELDLEYVTDQIGENSNSNLNNYNSNIGQYLILIIICSLCCCFLAIAAVFILYLLLHKKK